MITKTRAAWWVLSLAAATVVVVVVYAIISAATNTTDIRDTQVDRTSQNEVNDETLRIIKDCTDVDGKCFRESQARTAEALASIQRIIVLSAACSVSVDPSASVESRVADITACVTEGLVDP